ncbi:nuclear transport factor 2 family protein [Parafrigoribacterium soli]|uniref:nuclear transport factor 2 family protein n=1 Tax=Parafrigoribacterium soli TaxID=3144663 RepID=UPI0032EBA8D1
MDANDDPRDGPRSLIKRLLRATNEHDIESLVACFASDYRNETPAHPARGFVGRDQVRRNWEQIFALVPDVAVELVGSAVDGDTVWSEWEHSGTRTDGSRHHMRGVLIFGVANGLAEWARFFLEPVDDGGVNVDVAVARQVSAAGAP